MSGRELLELLPEKPGAVLANWRGIREKIHDEFDKATTEDERVALLTVYTTVMNIVEPTIAAKDRAKFREARQQDYNLLLAKEYLVGENVCVQTAYAVTRREVAAGRMPPDDSLHVGIAAAIAAPHLSRA